MAMTRTDRPATSPDERAPSAALTWLFVAFAAGAVAFAALRFGLWAAAAAGGAALAGLVAGRLAGVTAGLARSARTRADLHERLVAAEGAVVRSKLTALRGSSTGDDKALMEETARREAAEAALAEERAQRKAVSDVGETSIAEERRQRQILQDQAQRAIAEERRQRQVLHEQAEHALAEERKQRQVLQEQMDRTLADERKQRQALQEQVERAQRSATAENQALREATAIAQREAERLSSAQNGALREVERVLAPYIEREKLLLDLARIEGGTHSRQDLPRILDTIAKKASFASIVLADESGLPVAASRGSRDPEGTAATSSLLFTLADRLAAHGQPEPMSVLVHDTANETILHRLFRAGEARYLLTATGRGRGVVPETLDPTLDAIERALLQEAWAPS